MQLTLLSRACSFLLIVLTLSMDIENKMFLENDGFCPICETNVHFSAKFDWLRDHYLCSNCGSVPRERALMDVIKKYYPNWRDVVIHESSPENRGASCRLQRECQQYIASQYFPKEKPGSLVDDMRCENLEALTFADESIDIHISQDVLEHVFHPEKAFAELARTLRPGGMHIFTVPLVNQFNPSKCRARFDPEGYIVHLEDPMYHGSPVGDGKALVTYDWGLDICNYIFNSSGLFTQVIYINDVDLGIKAELNEVLLSYKAFS